jgi:hypothetical protein
MTLAELKIAAKKIVRGRSATANLQAIDDAPHDGAVWQAMRAMLAGLPTPPGSGPEGCCTYSLLTGGTASVTMTAAECKTIPHELNPNFVSQPCPPGV